MNMVLESLFQDQVVVVLRFGRIVNSFGGAFWTPEHVEISVLAELNHFLAELTYFDQLLKFQNIFSIFLHSKTSFVLKVHGLLRFREYRFNWDFQGHNSHEMAMQEFYQEADPEDPFDEHPLPFYMEYQFHDMESYETQLRTGDKKRVLFWREPFLISTVT